MHVDGQPWTPPAETALAAIAWWAAATPASPALLGVSGEAVSYSALHERIEFVARQFRARGIGRGDRVMLALPDGLSTTIAGLAAMRAAVAVPVNPALSPAEAALVCAAVAPQAVVVAQGQGTAYRDIAAHTGTPVLTLGADGLLANGGEQGATSDDAFPSPTGNDLAMILLTSGTTDVPRLVPAIHRHVLDTCLARAKARRLSQCDRGLSSAPAYFVLGLARVIESLLGGGSAIVTTAREIVQAPEAIRDLQPTWSWMSPAMLETVLAAAQGNSAFRDWPLRFVRLGGAQVTPDLVARAQAFWGVPALNGYGTTETLGYIAAEESPETVPRRAGSVGLARPGLEIAIRDDHGAALPDGSTGEITVRRGVFTGYLGDPVATAAAFFPGGWYRTGDVGHRDEEGYLFVTGRSREMINRGGEKIAPQEIDDILRGHPAIADAAAFALPERRLGEEVAAAVVLRAGASLDERALRRWAAARLSPHKVPRRIWFLDALPRTGSSKVQRGVLSTRFRDAVRD
jgi:acyl-CoA synthetase (AMP-forming)/AMP-acid ligase II